METTAEANGLVQKSEQEFSQFLMTRDRFMKQYEQSRYVSVMLREQSDPVLCAYAMATHLS